MLHHWQEGNHNQMYNGDDGFPLSLTLAPSSHVFSLTLPHFVLPGGHSFSRDGQAWNFSSTAAYSKNISWATPIRGQRWTVMERRERPGLLLDSSWRTPLYLFTAVAGVLHPGQLPGSSWLQSQPIRQARDTRSGGAVCVTDDQCNLNGICSAHRCECDAQWDGSACGVLALLPADPDGGYRRLGWNGWGGNPFYSEHTKKYHVFTVEMVRATGRAHPAHSTASSHSFTHSR